MKICVHFKYLLMVMLSIIVEKMFHLNIGIYIVAALVYIGLTHKEETVNLFNKIKEKFVSLKK